MPVDALSLAIAAAAVASLVVALLVLFRTSRLAQGQAEIAAQVRGLGDGATTLDRVLREEAARSREEASREGRGLREEVRGSLAVIQGQVVQSLDTLSAAQRERLAAVEQAVAGLTEANERRQEALRVAVEQRLAELKGEAGVSARQMREEVTGSLGKLASDLRVSVADLARTQNERLDSVRMALDTGIAALRRENEAKLEAMRQTVDEKLQGTLEKRLGESFGLVSKQLELVHKSVGEMQTLATGVGDLKRVLTNVKARGTWGEVSLGSLLEQVMAPDQFARNVEVVPGSGQRVEYAIRLPGRGEDETPVWLPIDAKFPHEDYDRLVEAAERGDKEAEEAALRGIEQRIRGAAKDICDKYVQPPHTTDFGIMFLPTEGLYAEVLRRPGLASAIQLDCKVSIAGPTTLTAVLNSLQMGFRSLAIQKRSSEVWEVLGAVKTEFEKYGDVLDKVQKRLRQADGDIEAVRRRERAIGRRLRAVESLPEADAGKVLQIEDFIADAEALPALGGPAE